MGTTSVQTMSRKHENSTRLSGQMRRYSPSRNSRKDKEESNLEVSRGRKSNKKNLAVIDQGVTRDVSGSGRAVVRVAIVLRALAPSGKEMQAIGLRAHQGRSGCGETGIAGCCYSGVDCVETWVLINSDGCIRKVEQESRRWTSGDQVRLRRRWVWD